ncbi:hypothetical protein [Riemerella anatipestifer]|uniref:Uncharacterized protein n=1 Tax=Riemerella anatipestifer TaxID=34085 RepID=A0A1S7DU97_RIEAN|nr:hypothetical protein [Riemerella anatipestifer]AQY22690.1 hypothetical protein AB406_1748 [Riemerella anatipestifer]MDR7695371.1 hypothetical protein [Riemerella anatipestifer]MDR7795377.1 hypothetical protein [Riemerella anatipestifer]MDY3402905.1 hypothetical protein [Riemerella anatipestifer]MRM84384.1 hypothetical protein [Riemerella anatipestifer]
MEKSKNILQAEFTQELADWVRDCKDYGDAFPGIKRTLFEMIEGIPEMNNIMNPELMSILLKQALRLSFIISDNIDTVSEFIKLNTEA